ncbi:MAG TPA: helix-turn-helix transcriptional regulator [Chitinophagaceae bacterium]
MIASLIKDGRAAKGYTQKKLSELSNISIRSIQRIENGEIEPRSYTLKTLAGILGISFETIGQEQTAKKIGPRMTHGQKLILSIGIVLFVFLACWAFIAQSSKFPETSFELLILSALVVVVITVALLFTWRKRS